MFMNYQPIMTMTNKYDTFRVLQQEWAYHATNVYINSENILIIDSYLKNNGKIYHHPLSISMYLVRIMDILAWIKQTWVNHGVNKYDLDHIMPQIEKELRTYAKLSTDQG